MHVCGAVCVCVCVVCVRVACVVCVRVVCVCVRVVCVCVWCVVNLTANNTKCTHTLQQPTDDSNGYICTKLINKSAKMLKNITTKHN